MALTSLCISVKNRTEERTYIEAQRHQFVEIGLCSSITGTQSCHCVAIQAFLNIFPRRWHMWCCIVLTALPNPMLLLVGSSERKICCRAEILSFFFYGSHKITQWTIKLPPAVMSVTGSACVPAGCRIHRSVWHSRRVCWEINSEKFAISLSNIKNSKSKYHTMRSGREPLCYWFKTKRLQV